jgi:hypothetical protein
VAPPENAPRQVRQSRLQADAAITRSNDTVNVLNTLDHQHHDFLDGITIVRSPA